MGAKEYFIHQPNLEEPAEFRGWYRDTSGEIVEMLAVRPRTLFSERLNLLFTWNVFSSRCHENAISVQIASLFVPRVQV